MGALLFEHLALYTQRFVGVKPSMTIYQCSINYAPRSNYKMYLKSGVFGISTAGRYLFPVLLPLCGLISHYMINFFSKKKQLIITILVSAWFIYGDFIFFLKVVPDYWLVHNWPI